MATDKAMQLGMIGLGRMGANLVRRLMRDGHHCVAYDVNADAVKAMSAEGAVGTSTRHSDTQPSTMNRYHDRCPAPHHMADSSSMSPKYPNSMRPPTRTPMLRPTARLSLTTSRGAGRGSAGKSRSMR